MRYFYWFFLTLCLSASPIVAADVTELTATVDKNPILVDESVLLQVTAVGGADRDDIDFTVLTQDFRVSQPSVSQSTQIINFDRTTTTTWSLQLFPRATGQFTIPSFTIDGQTSNEINLTVLPVTEAARTQPREFFVTAEVSDEVVYLQQQVQYTVKIFLAGDIQRGSLSEPVLDGAVIEQLGDDKEYQELVNGVRYRVIERNFAVLPQASGAYTIDGPVFQAEVLTATRQSFAYFNRSKSISRVAPVQTITVLPIPDNYPYTWLPSEQVQISEEWPNDIDELIQGEPVTRIVTLTALGLIEEQLPRIDAVYHPDFKTYPEQPVKATINRDSNLIAQVVQSTAIIPSQTGNYVLPEIRIPWFDVNSAETRYAVLPARSVRVIPPLQQTNSEQALGNTPQSSADDVALSKDEASSSAQTSSRFIHVAWGLDILHMVLFCLVIFMGVMLWLKRKLPQTPNSASNEHQVPVINSENEAWQALEYAIEHKNVSELQKSLKVWLNTISATKVGSITNALNAMDAQDVTQAFNQLLAQSYAHNTESSDFAPLKQALQQLRQQQFEQYQVRTRSSMYPI
ncbi:BatD family protein [Glaciecola sp. XM2]|jgi:hypothetical protein|uniref:BatD family protein n=1 Tax=Glaciecola sp. XM2 TaxID=1914931 RepID=UPI001BDEB43D|nr:BatD family protein [Glaciecola sp. XM2]MBT1449912.1 BatD family protein [Glaciecola sp. XM2]